MSKKRIGIDFGTTNSTIAYLDDQGRMVAHEFGGPGGAKYFPSAIAYAIEAETAPQLMIGVDAKNCNETNPGKYNCLEYYKLNLFRGYDCLIEPNHCKTVIDVVKDYLRNMISRYKDEAFNRDERPAKLEYIALALPNCLHDPENKTDQALADRIKEEIGQLLNDEADKHGFYGESTCACQYYVNRYERDFNGHIVVVDYGGGTLDISNCNVNKNNTDVHEVKVVTQRGTGIDEMGNALGLGYAGVAFDHHVVSQFSQIHSDDDHITTLRRIQFEDYKIRNSRQINENLMAYYSEGTNNELQWRADFNVNPCIITPQMLDEAFQKVNLSKLSTYFEIVVPQENRQGGGAARQASFRVLPIGGFSQLYCVVYHIRKFLGINPADLHDNRLAEVNANERFLAVAYGAALEANRSNSVIGNTSLYEIGVKAFDGLKTKNDTIVTENMQFAENDVSWRQNTYGIISGENAIITLYCSTSVSGESDAYPVDISEICNDNCRVKLGVSLENGEYQLHIENIEDKRKTTKNISDLIESYRRRSRR